MPKADTARAVDYLRREFLANLALSGLPGKICVLLDSGGHLLRPAFKPGMTSC